MKGRHFKAEDKSERKVEFSLRSRPDGPVAKLMAGECTDLTMLCPRDSDGQSSNDVVHFGQKIAVITPVLKTSTDLRTNITSSFVKIKMYLLS